MTLDEVRGCMELSLNRILSQKGLDKVHLQDDMRLLGGTNRDRLVLTWRSLSWQWSKPPRKILSREGSGASKPWENWQACMQGDTRTLDLEGVLRPDKRVFIIQDGVPLTRTAVGHYSARL